MNRGETNPHGILAFSWPHLKDGFATTKDKINLGYHEFAHALLLQESQEEYGDSQFDRGYQLFSVAMEQFKIARRALELDFLRDYAFTNKMEFFAVCSEHFMEAPEEMYEKFPGLYHLMCRMLRMDPITSRFHLHFQYDEEMDHALVARILNRTEPY
jgi:Mlc titration factor MtfA (ptsG expression regulator)